MEQEMSFIKESVGSSELADILGDTLLCQTPPLTVGVFGKWSSGKTQLLKRTRDRMEKLSSSPSDNKELSINILSLIYRLLFFNPVLNSTRNYSVRFLFVDFSILDYAGSDKLWAGVITHISNEVDQAFGKWAVKIFRSWHYKPECHLTPFLEETDELSITSKRWKCAPCRVFIIPILILALIATGITCWFVFGVPSLGAAETTSSSDVTTIAVTCVIGVGAAAKITDILTIVLNLAKTQVQKIHALSKKADFSSSLGFMGAVKNEVYYITSVLRYMGVFLDKEIRLCLIIDDVDLLGKEKIMTLFQVVSILQSSRNSSYLQILCMDPTIAANLIKKALRKELSSNISGHAFLRKHVQLPFHIPPLDYKPRHSKTSKTIYNEEGEGIHDENRCEADGLLSHKKQDIPMQNLSKTYCCSETIDKVQEYLLFDLNLAQFIDGNERALKRVTTSAQLAVHMMMLRAAQCPISRDIKHLVAWTCLVDQWPYRVSWIRQIVEDNEQMHRIDSHLIHKFCGNALLADVYQLVEGKLSNPVDWRDLLDLDGDPQLFLGFLQLHPFTVQDMKTFLPNTTNLNNSLRSIIAQCSAKDFIFRKTALQVENSQQRWWHSRPLEHWTIDDVCNEMRYVGINEKFLETYHEIIRENKISGETLCSRSLSDLQLYLKMTPGDWVLFKSTFSALKTFYGIS